VLDAPCRSRRAHALRVGDVVPVAYPARRIGSEDSPTEMVVTGRSVEYEGVTVNTTLELTGVDAPGVIGVTSGT
jgi:class 3 adenylate cyclase